MTWYVGSLIGVASAAFAWAVYTIGYRLGRAFRTEETDA